MTRLLNLVRALDEIRELRDASAMLAAKNNYLVDEICRITAERDRARCVVNALAADNARLTHANLALLHQLRVNEQFLAVVTP